MTYSPIVGWSTLQRSALCKHWIVEFFDIPDLNTITQTEIIEHALHEAAEAAGATVLFNKMHSFGPDCGVTGVAVLAESHISIHTWPEHSYAAIDIFLCGMMDPSNAMDVLSSVFEPKNYKTRSWTNLINCFCKGKNVVKNHLNCEGNTISRNANCSPTT